MKQLLVLCLLCGLGFGQSSHRDLTTELLKNLNKVISDSTSLPMTSLHPRFVEESNLDVYLNSCLPRNQNGEENRRVDITATNFTLTINLDPTKTVRNSRYLRQLELNVLFSYDQTEFVWRGKISDNLSKAQLKTLLEEETPFEVGGDYAKGEPPVPLIILTTAGVFALGAALFFIRT
ncbi:MAG: hypothetical protein ISR87_10310 [Candidatus Marinimicrobia bacterium]|nr:hypothetical protein [FCB group bacterium]MBL7025837.1 hypothetical protein [Candidatus Neomarinimicrobiota bacterium]